MSYRTPRAPSSAPRKSKYIRDPAPVLHRARVVSDRVKDTIVPIPMLRPWETLMLSTAEQIRELSGQLGAVNRTVVKGVFQVRGTRIRMKGKPDADMICALKELLDLIPWHARFNISDMECSIDFSGTDFTDADLSGMNLSRVNLSHVDLSYANMAGADLRGTYLCNAYLSDTILTRANLYRANLTDATLILVDMKGALCLGSKGYPLEELRDEFWANITDEWAHLRAV